MYNFINRRCIEDQLNGSESQVQVTYIVTRWKSYSILSPIILWCSVISSAMKTIQIPALYVIFITRYLCWCCSCYYYQYIVFHSYWRKTIVIWCGKIHVIGGLKYTLLLCRQPEWRQATAEDRLTRNQNHWTRTWNHRKPAPGSRLPTSNDGNFTTNGRNSLVPRITLLLGCSFALLNRCTSRHQIRSVWVMEMMVAPKIAFCSITFTKNSCAGQHEQSSMFSHGCRL